MIKMGSVSELAEAAKKSEGVILFGAGRRIGKVEGLFSGTAMIEKIRYIVDNDIYKQGTGIVIGRRCFPIISFDDFVQKDCDHMLLMITNKAYEPILEQLESYGKFRNMKIYCLEHCEGFTREEDALKKEVPKDIRLTSEPLIPKVIHYCWFGKNPIPDEHKRYMESWHKYCPDYEIREWNESNYDVTKNPYMYQAYQKKKWGFVPDYARLDIIYHHGGIYLDTDVEIIANIDDLLHQLGFCGFEFNESVAFGLGFGAVKGFHMIGELLHSYDDRQFIKEDGSLNLVASPYYQTEFLKGKGLVLNGEYQSVDGLTVYPEKMLCGKNISTLRVRLAPYTRMIHHYAGSWVEPDVKIELEKKEARMRKLYMDYS